MYFVSRLIAMIVLVSMNAATSSGNLQMGDNADLIRFIIILITGIIGFFVFVKLSKIAFFFLGGMMGLVLSIIVLSLEFVANLLQNNAARSTFILVMALVFGLWTFLNERVIVIISGCVVGSYSLFVGMDYWVESGIGAFMYHAFYLEPILFTFKSYAMLVAFIFVACGGIYYHLKLQKNSSPE